MSCSRRAAALPLGAFVLASFLLAGCEPQRGSQSARTPWSPQASYGGQPPARTYDNRGPEPYALPGGSEARDPWGARQPSLPAPPVAADVGPFLILTSLQGSAPEQREPTVNALIARLGGIRRAPSLWEVAQSGAGLAAVAAALESELCAEDVVVFYRAHNRALERSELAGRRVCGPLAAPPAPTPTTSSPAKRPAVADPLHTRF